MARWPKQQQTFGVTPDEAPTSGKAPEFDRSAPYADVQDGQTKYWRQNGWLYARGTARPVREVK